MNILGHYDFFATSPKKALHLPCGIYNMTYHELYTLVKSCEDSLFARQVITPDVDNRQH